MAKSTPKLITRKGWPKLVSIMVSDSHKVMGLRGITAKALNGGHLEMEFAKNFLETLYEAGYVVAQKQKVRIES